jgi:hypothetical protein
MGEQLATCQVKDRCHSKVIMGKVTPAVIAPMASLEQHLSTLVVLLPPLPPDRKPGTDVSCKGLLQGPLEQEGRPNCYFSLLLRDAIDTTTYSDHK